MAKFCTNCGNPVEPTQKMCLNCGAGIRNNETSSIEETNQNNYSHDTSTHPPKSKVVAGVLAIFLGSLGVHNFYLGYTSKAIAQLLISVLSCFALSAISSVWALIEGVMILTGSINKDANGNPLSDN